MARGLRGLEKYQEQESGLLIRDTRTLGKRIYDFFQSPRNAAILILAAVVGVMTVGAPVADLILIICIGMFIYTYTRRISLPFRLPMFVKILDSNDPKPGSNKPSMARGICFYGNERKTDEELWFNNDDMRTHTLIFGSTGSGKTETLISLAYNSLVFGSGFIYVDGKGDNSLFAKIFSMARSVGREDDVLVLNFMTGARDIVGAQAKRLSNTLNPFSQGSSSMLSQLVVSLMDSSSSASPDGDMWKGRAITFVEALMKVMVYMRDQGKILLDANTIRNYFILERLEAIVLDKMFPRDNQEPVSFSEAPPVILEPLYNYVINLPGYDKSKKGKQVSQVLEQHGFITMQLTRVFTSLADTYGHILRTNLAEVDLRDVVLNRRILVVLLPALEKSPDELANLGKIIIATLKAMMASGLGEEVEGEYRDVVLRKPTNAPTPYLCILDEYGYYAVKGFAVVPAQARSLGFSVIFAGQDLPAFQKASKEEAASIGANTNIKIAMKLEDPLETWEFFHKTAGEAYVTKVDSFQTDAQTISSTYRDARSASAEKRARVDLLDLKEQREGEMHIFFKSSIVRAKTFYANPKPSARMQLNQFLRIEQPTMKALVEFEQHLQRLSEIIESQSFEFKTPEFNQDIELISNSLKTSDSPTLIERGVAALLAYANQGAEKKLAETPVEEEETTAEPSAETLDIFTRVMLSELTRKIISEDQLAGFSEVLLQKKVVSQQIELMERLFGKSTLQAETVASELTRDMQWATSYPPIITESPDVSKIVSTIYELAVSLNKMKE